jgi:iron complex outermembrane recepter protein
MFSLSRWSVMSLALAVRLALPGTRAMAQVGSIGGKVTDEQGTALAGAQVTLDQTGKGAVSGATGSYTIEGVAAGSHTVRVRIIGYRSQTKTVSVASGVHATADFALLVDPLKLDAVVVTGTETPRTKLETSNATTVLSAADIIRADPRSTTEALRMVPGFTRIESSGGEVNENIIVRGLLGVEYVMFMEDGLPVFPTMHTFFMNADNLFRMDENIERMEVVRSASSALYGSNTPGAIINIINKTGGSTVSGSMKATGATEGLARYDFNANGPLSQDWRFNLGGFYRYDHGVRDPGYDGIRGGQLKMSLTHDLPNGYIQASLKYIDDRNQFILDLPMQNQTSPNYAPGFSDYGAMNTNEGLGVTVPIPTGQLTLPLENGIRTKAVWLTADAAFNFAGGWNVRNSAQIMQDQEEWNAIVNGDRFGTQSTIDSTILAQEGIGAVDSVKNFYTNVLNANGTRSLFSTPNNLLAEMGEWHVEKPLTAFQDQLTFKRSFDRGDAALGLYFANYTQGNVWYFTDILTDVQNNPHFVDLVAYRAGATIPVTVNGFRHFLSNYVNGNGQTAVFSGFGGVSLKLTDRLRADVGGRWENDNYVQNTEKDSTIALNGNTAPVDAEPFGTGAWRHFRRSIGEWAGSIGLNYRVNDRVAVYAQGSRAFKMPALDEFLNDTAQGQVDVTQPKHVETGEGGVKLLSGHYSLTLDAFYSVLKDISGQGAVIDPVTGRVTWETKTSPQQRSYGLEMEASANPRPEWIVLANATYLKAELGAGAGSDIGEWLNNVPRWIGNLSVSYAKSGFSLVGDWHFVDRRFSDVVNGVTLPAYSYFNFGGTYTLPGQSVRFFADLLNAFQSIGLEEGNPRAIAGTGGQFFFARPLLPRRFQAGMGYTF